MNTELRACTVDNPVLLRLWIYQLFRAIAEGAKKAKLDPLSWLYFFVWCAAEDESGHWSINVPLVRMAVGTSR
jgi:hypothetical protein